MRKQRGFTLIEVMVALAVIAILAAVALPSYSDYVKRGKIQEATTNLLAVRTKLEQYYQDNRRYDGGCTAGMPANQKYFSLSCTFAASPSQTYTVTATGQQDMNGFAYTIDQSNTRRTTAVPTGWSLPSTNCWAIKKSGHC